LAASAWVDVFACRRIVTGADLGGRDDDGDDRWKSDVSDILSDDDDGLVLRDDSLEALEMSGQEMWRLFRFRPPRKEQECLRGVGSGTGGGSLPAAAEDPPLLRCHIHGHLLEENPALMLFLRRRLDANPFADDSACCTQPNGASSLRSKAEEPRVMVGETEDAVDFCRKCRRILGRGAGDRDDDRTWATDGGEGGSGTGGTDPERKAGPRRSSSESRVAGTSSLGRRLRRGGRTEADWLKERPRSRFGSDLDPRNSIVFGSTGNASKHGHRKNWKRTRWEKLFYRKRLQNTAQY
jgi:hypothetical protein